MHLELILATFKIGEMPEIEPATSWLVVRHPEPRIIFIKFRIQFL